LILFSTIFAVLLIGPPEKMGPIRSVIANLYDEIGLIDAFVQSKHKFGRVKVPFTHGKDLSGKASLIYVRALTEDAYRCQMIFDELGLSCTMTLRKDFLDAVIAKTSANDANPKKSALWAVAQQLNTMRDDYRIVARGVGITQKSE
jgi:hypothetical protein